MYILLPKPREMDFNSSNLAAAWKKWRQNMEFCLTDMIRGKIEEEKYSVFLFLIGKQGRNIFNTTEWVKKADASGNQTEEDDITVKKLFKRFREYCLPKKNLVVERTFFWKNQYDDETFDQFMTELRNLSSTCEFGDLNESLLLYKVVNGIILDKIRYAPLRKGIEMTLEKAITIWRTEEMTKMQMKEMDSEKEMGGISRNQQQKKAQKRKEDQIIDRRKKIRRYQLRTWMGRHVNFLDKFANQESVLHMGRNATSPKEESLGKLLYDQESTQSIYQV